VLQFEWDGSKAAQNFRKHKVSFEEAATVFEDPFSLVIEDPQHSASEERYVIVGESSRKRLIVVVHTDRNNAIRIISARPATRKERKAYEET
jgi:hypothetical protein